MKKINGVWYAPDPGDKGALEINRVKRMLEYLNRLPCCRAVKVAGTMRRSGEPDIDGCIEGWSLKIEAKRGGNKATEQQVAILEKWAQTGAIAAVVYTYEQIQQILKAEHIL